MANKERFSLADVEDALRLANGIVSRARKILETKYGACGYNTVKGYLQRHPELQALKEELEDEMLDAVEAKAHKLILKDEDSSMIRFYLATKGRKRGWGQKVETTGPGGGPVLVSAVVPTMKEMLRNLSAEERAVLEKMVANSEQNAGETSGDDED